MRTQLESYVNLLFAGTTDTDDIKQEILQNTLDRYDDLVAQGKAPEAAYRLAISGIGDINEILGQEKPAAPSSVSAPDRTHQEEDKNSKLTRAVAIAMYIACPIPLFALGDTIGLSMMCLLIAAATALMVMSGKKEPVSPVESTPLPTSTPKRSAEAQRLVKAIGSVNLVVCLAIYLVTSFLTHAWVITWLIFPLSACIQGLITAIIDLKEAT